MKLTGISRLILKLAVLPATVATVVLAAWLVTVHVLALADHQRNLGQSVITQLGPATEYGLFSGDIMILQRLADAALQEAGLHSVVIRDAVGTILVEAISDNPAGRLAHFALSVVAPEVELGEFDAPDQASARHLGTVEIAVPLDPVLTMQVRAAATGLVVLLLVLVVSIYAAIRMGARIARPIERLADAMRRMQRGERGVRVAESSRNELGALESGLNRMADEVERTQQTLEKRVRQAVADLKESIEALEVSNVELDLARQRAIEASHQKSEFFAAMSHDLRTPLAGIIGFARLLDRSELAPHQKEHLLAIQQSADSLMRIIGNILDLSRIEAGKLALVDAPFDLRSCIDVALNLIAPLAYEKGLRLDRTVTDDVPWCLRGDPVRIERILANLLSNAVKHTSVGRVTVRAGVEDRLDGRVRIRLEVEDTGRGIVEADQRLLFRSFSQPVPSTATYPGTGLGLAICSQLADAMDGEIRLDSEPGKGSRFIVTLSLREDRPVPVIPEPRARVALYEGDEGTAHHITQLLQSSGFIVKDGPPADADICIVDGHDPDAMERVAGHDRVLVLCDGFREPPRDGWSSLPRVATRDALVRAIDRLLGVTPNQSAGQGSRNRLSGMRLLVVDDNRINLTLLAQQCIVLGAEVVTRHDGASALPVADSVDVALLDLQMPGMSGTELARRLAESHPDLVLLAVTANAFAAEDGGILQVGFSDILLKPVDDARLVEAVHTAIHRHSSLRASLAALAPEVIEMLRGDLPGIRDRLAVTAHTGDADVRRATLHDLAGIAGACRLKPLSEVVHAGSGDRRSVAPVLTVMSILLREVERAWKDVTG